MKKIILSCFIGFFIMNHAVAGGFKIGLQGLKQTGMGHTGIGLAQDASTIYFNPAGMSFVESQINGGIHLLIPNISFLDKKTNELTNATSQIFTPFSIYAKVKLAKKLDLGLGVYTPFGSGVMYPSDWTGRYILSKISLQTVFVQPTLSYRISDEISIGAGYIYASGNIQLEKDLPILTGPTQQVAHASLEGKANGAGYNVGVYYKPNAKTSMGLTYHSKVVMKVDDGDATFDNIPLGLQSNFPANNSFSSTLNLPSEIGYGVAYNLTPRVQAAFDFNYTFWNSYDSLGFDYGQNTAALQDTKSPRLYENAMAFRMGLQAKASAHWIIRAGAFYDQTPVQDGYVAPELPDNNKIGLTIGSSIQLHDRLSLDLSCLYENVIKRTGVNVETGLDGTFQTKVIAPAIGLTYLFHKKVEAVPVLSE